MNKTTRLKKPQIPELDKLYRFDDLGGRPKYGGSEMTSNTNIPDFDEIRDETHSMVVAEATARANADVALQDSLSTVVSDLAAEASARASADEAESTARQNADASEALARASADESEASTRQAADTNLQTQIDAIIAGSDVKDVVATYAELEAYDTSTLGDNDIIKVLADETQGGAESYYRYHASTDQFTLIGTKAASYTKSETDTLLNTKVDKVTGKQLSTNDYTTAEQTKLAGIEAGAQVNKLDNVWSLPMTEAQWDEAITREAAGEPFIIKDFDNNTFRGKFATHVGRGTNNLKFIGLREQSDGSRYTPSVTVYNLAKDNGQYKISGTSEYKVMSPIDNLTTAQSDRYSLDAHQGKVLKDLVDTKQDILTAGDNITIANNVISAEGGVKTLTTEDYNYPTSAPDRVALNYLPAGVYKIAPNTRYTTLGTDSTVYTPYDGVPSLAIVFPVSGSVSTSDRVSIIYTDNFGQTKLAYAVRNGTGQPSSFYTGNILGTGSVVDNLTSTATGRPLSAAQGKYLNDNKADKTAFTGTDGAAAGTMGLVPAPAAGDESKFLKADGTWATAGGSGPTIVQTTGTSTTDVMSQNAVTGMIYENPTTALNGSALKIGSDNTYAAPIYGSLAIGKRASAPGNGSIAINGYQSTYIGASMSAAGEGSIIIGGAGGTSNGNDNILIDHDHYGSALTINESSVIRIGRHRGGETYGIGSIAVGHGCEASGNYAVAIGGNVAGGVDNDGAHALANNSIALGYGSSASAKGEMNIGTRSNLGYSSSNYRLLTGLYDPQNDHDAATKGYVDSHSATTLTNTEFNSILENA